jgi:hypothetical protein
VQALGEFCLIVAHTTRTSGSGENYRAGRCGLPPGCGRAGAHGGRRGLGQGRSRTGQTSPSGPTGWRGQSMRRDWSPQVERFRGPQGAGTCEGRVRASQGISIQPNVDGTRLQLGAISLSSGMTLSGAFGCKPSRAGPIHVQSAPRTVCGHWGRPARQRPIKHVQVVP